MKYNFKKGDKLKIIDASDSASDIREGMIVVCNEDVNTDSGSKTIYVILPNKNTDYFLVSRFEKVGKSNYKPLNPTHVVIWEEDTDPAKLFTSEEDAKGFIKELSDKGSVKKDSILLIEIKSCKKVGINKVLRYNQHKI